MVFALMIADGQCLLPLRGCKDGAMAFVNKTNCCYGGEAKGLESYTALKS